MPSSPVRIAAITSNASLVVALTLRVEDWDITSAGTTASVDGLESSDVVLIDRGTTELGLAELLDARDQAPNAPAIVIGDEEPEEPTDAVVLLRPFTLEDLATAINEAGNSDTTSAPVESEGAPPTRSAAPASQDDVFDDEHAKPTPTAPPVDPAVVPLDVAVEVPDAEPTTFFDDEPAPATTTETAPEPAPESVDVEPEPFTLDEDLDAEPAPVVATIAPSSSLITDDEDEDEDPLEQLVDEVVEARHAKVETAAPKPEAPAAPPAPPPAAEARAPERQPADRPEKRKRGRRWGRSKPELAGPAELAAKQMAAAASSAARHPNDFRSRIASVLVSGAELHRLVNDMPILRSSRDLAEVLAGEVQEELSADTVAVWVLEASGFRVAGGRGLTNAEAKAVASPAQPLLADLQETGAASLIIPLDLASHVVGGIAGARTNALLATAISIGPDRYAFLTVGADDYTEEDLDRLVELAVEAAPFFAIARLMDSLRAR